MQTTDASLRNVSITNDAIVEGGPEADAALDKVSSDLRAQSTISRKARGRRDLRNTIYGQVGGGDQAVVRDVLGSPIHREDPFLGSAPVSAGSALSRTVQGNGLQTQAGDTDSIRSGRSGMSGMGNVTRHTEPLEDGVHLSVVETVSVVLDVEGSGATDVRVTGEAALAMKGMLDPSPVLLKVQSPDAISRLVANTNILQSQDESTYQISGQSANSMTTLFKYQVQPDQARANRFLPILLSQKWSPEDAQTSVKLTYRLNPAFGARNLTLQDVEISLGINGVANSCVAKPAGSFVKKSNKLVWKLNEFTLEAGQEQSLLARFKTDGLASPGSLELRWKTAPSNLSRGSGFGVTATRSRANPFSDESVVENVMVSHAYTLSAARYSVTVPSASVS
ncbi:Muniscin C-terminal mu homology domain-domain-containing protein [Protomyces lactucae-debilis]|uniref:Muniscin C-terminal mu homology domain-domain-containing protein n=1 Tax=Protomyces lactucae-debilis TaxID=2754530 RepID=A0A1Y2F2X0_PROLT|nr:Muniscin C-terminal mu homology domain-containing protein [Protomyces lactucae-debilis]ORY78240.1 Muniscin C-terminal mu homology domain-domain-containing protein [Protomyces lactucae-debilis]